MVSSSKSVITTVMVFLIVLSVVDWNPSGVQIFCVYKYGSTRRGSAFGLAGLQWLAARAALLHGVPDRVLQVRFLTCTPTVAE